MATAAPSGGGAGVADGGGTAAVAVGCGASEGRVGGRMRFTWSASASTSNIMGN